MKRLFINCLLITLIILIAFDLYDNAFYNNGEIIRTEYVNNLINISTEGNITNRHTKKLLKLIETIPSHILECFNEYGFQVVLTDVNIAERYYQDTSLGDIAGLFVENESTIYISSKRNYINHATIHEFGHFFDYINDWSSTSEDFINIYIEEKDNLQIISHDNHYKSSSSEFFATSFQQYLKNPKKLKNEAPKTYNYLKGLIRNGDEISNCTYDEIEIICI